MEIAQQDYFGRRLDRDQWERFRLDVERAYRKTVSPLLGEGVTDAEACTPGRDEGRQGFTNFTF
jgi:hypothetical protein